MVGLVRPETVVDITALLHSIRRVRGGCRALSSVPHRPALPPVVYRVA